MSGRVDFSPLFAKATRGQGDATAHGAQKKKRWRDDEDGGARRAHAAKRARQERAPAPLSLIHI